MNLQVMKLINKTEKLLSALIKDRDSCITKEAQDGISKIIDEKVNFLCELEECF